MPSSLPHHDVELLRPHPGAYLLSEVPHAPGKLFRPAQLARLPVTTTNGFSYFSLLLAAVGTYGVMSYTVAERTSEIGIRMALGTGAPRVLRMVIGHGLLLTVAGLVTLLELAYALSRFVASFLFGVRATGLTTFATVPLVLLSVALAACLVPAFRAMRVEPVTALRYE